MKLAVLSDIHGNYIALQKWNLKNSDKNIIIEALDRFATEKQEVQLPSLYYY